MSSNSSSCKQSFLELLITKQDSSFPWSQNPGVDHQKNGPIGNYFGSNVSGEGSTSCWNFLQAPKITSYDLRPIMSDPNQVYVNPLAKHWTPSLSLEMCTETLGNETGSSIDPSLDDYSYIILEEQSSGVTRQSKTREFRKKINCSSSFPPPLSSISGSNSVGVQTHREAGRLVITAFSSSANRFYFEAQRKNGRLRLFLLKNNYMRSERELAEKLEEEEEEEEDGGKLGRKRGSEELPGSRCNGDGSCSEKLPSLPVCVAFS